MKEYFFAHHLNLECDGSEYSREIANVWNRYYDTAEKYAKKEVVGIKNQLTTNALNFG